MIFMIFNLYCKIILCVFFLHFVYDVCNIIIFIIRPKANIGNSLRGKRTVLTRSAITPSKVI